MREPVTRARIEAFLREFGRRVNKPARLLLTGGAAMVLRGLRAETEDIDFSYTIDPRHDMAVIDAVRELKERLAVNLELAEPGQFMPMPAGREGRQSYVDRFGTIDVFLDDPYSMAIAKLQRSHAKDLRDIGLMLRAGLVDGDELAAKVREVAQARTPTVINVNQDKMLARLDEVRRSAAAGGLTPPAGPP